MLVPPITFGTRIMQRCGLAYREKYVLNGNLNAAKVCHDSRPSAKARSRFAQNHATGKLSEQLKSIDIRC
jgi:hypothetical protein